MRCARRWPAATPNTPGPKTPDRVFFISETVPKTDRLVGEKSRTSSLEAVGEVIGHQRIGSIVLPSPDRLDVADPAQLHDPHAHDRQLGAAALLDDGHRHLLEFVAATHLAPRRRRPLPLLTALPAGDPDRLVAPVSGEILTLPADRALDETHAYSTAAAISARGERIVRSSVTWPNSSEPLNFSIKAAMPP